jgi:hypothetical protein
MAEEVATRGVWLFARPQTDHSATASNDNIGLGCWGILLTELSVDNIKTLALRRNKSLTDEIDLGEYIHVGSDIDMGTLWELLLVGNRYTVKAHHEFNLSYVQWRSFSGQFIGETDMSDENIQIEGTFLNNACSLKAMRIIKEHPYNWISENGQTYSQSLLKAINPEFDSSKSIKAMSDRWLTLAIVPPSILTSDENGTFLSVSDHLGFSVRRGGIASDSANTEQSTSVSMDQLPWPSSRRRVLRELDELNWSAVDGITAYSDDLGKLQCFIAGPVDSPYTGSRSQ